MIRVTVEIVPFGVESRARKVGEMVIANDGTGDNKTGNYDACLQAEYTEGRPGRLTEFSRSASVWTLVGSFLKLWGHTGHSPKKMSKTSERDMARWLKS